MKLSSRILIVFFVTLAFSGCSAGQNQDSDPHAMTVWHWMSDRHDMFCELAGRFEKSTGIKVRFELFAPSEVYRQRIKASAQTGRLPDIYGILGEKRDFASYIRSGYVKNLSFAMALGPPGAPIAWKDTFFEKALAVNAFEPLNVFGIEPGIYGVPLDASTIQMIYNKKIYREAGLDPERPPLTWGEFVEHNRILKKKGYPGFVSGYGELWMIEAMASNWAMNWMGEKKVFATYEGKVSYMDPDWLKVLSVFKEMADEKILVEGAVTMVNKSAEQTFVNERATYAFNGSWSVNVYKGMNPRLDYGSFPTPALSSGHPMRVWGGAGSSFVINNRSKKQEAAVRFLLWLTSQEQQVDWAEATENLPSTRAALKHVLPVVSQFAQSLPTAIHPNTYPVHEYPAVSEAFTKGIQYILIGEKTPERVAREVQRIKEKEMAKDGK